MRSRWDFGCPHHHPGAWHSSTCGILALPQVDLLAPAPSAWVVPRHPSAGSLGRHDRLAAARDFAFFLCVCVCVCVCVRARAAISYTTKNYSSVVYPGPPRGGWQHGHTHTRTHTYYTHYAHTHYTHAHTLHAAQTHTTHVHTHTLRAHTHYVHTHTHTTHARTLTHTLHTHIHTPFTAYSVADPHPMPHDAATTWPRDTL